MTHSCTFLIAITVLLMVIIVHDRMINQAQLKVGDQAPDFSLSDAQGKTYHLAEMVGSKVALIFYPKDNSYLCTQQMCSVRDAFAELKDQGIVVWAISSDSPQSHQEFSNQQHLPFTLLSDPVKRVIAQYGLKGWVYDTRSTFLINENGTIVAIIAKDIDVKNHAQQIIDAFQKNAATLR